jgi:hypothetical protein
MDQFGRPSCRCSTSELFANQNRILEFLAALESLLQRSLQELTGGKTKNSPEQTRSSRSLLSTKEAAEALRIAPSYLEIMDGPTADRSSSPRSERSDSDNGDREAYWRRADTAAQKLGSSAGYSTFLKGVHQENESGHYWLEQCYR